MLQLQSLFESNKHRNFESLVNKCTKSDELMWVRNYFQPRYLNITVTSDPVTPPFRHPCIRDITGTVLTICLSTRKHAVMEERDNSLPQRCIVIALSQKLFARLVIPVENLTLRNLLSCSEIILFFKSPTTSKSACY
jgi:hypothetical protein